jgi:hypothetical protein
MSLRKIAIMLVSSILLPWGVLAAESPAEARPIHYIRTVDGDERPLGEYLLVHDNEATPPEILGLVEVAPGYKAVLTFWLDRDEGVSVQRFADLSSGWWIERRHDLGIHALGGPDDFHDSQEWISAVRERHEREKPTAVYSLTTSEGVHVEWTRPWGASEEGVAQARTDALATLAAELSGSRPPSSSVAALRFVAALGTGPEADKLSSFQAVIEDLHSALHAALPSAAGDLEVSLSVGGESAGARRMLTMLDERESKGPARQDEKAKDRPRG